MSEKREYSNETIVALAAWSRGTCYFPGCPSPLVVKRSGKPVIAAQIAHIAALKEKGERFDSGLTVAQRNDWPNLIFLCQADHTEVDRKNPAKYPADVLLAWKAGHEADGMAGLRGLSDLTEDKLEGIIEKSMETLRSDVKDALNEIRGINARTADMIERLLDQSQAQEFGSEPNLNEDTISALSQAAGDLAHLEDTASTLMQAADKLSGWEDIVAAIDNAADSLRRASPEY